jgi:hypothetical protein
MLSRGGRRGLVGHADEAAVATPQMPGPSIVVGILRALDGALLTFAHTNKFSALRLLTAPALALVGIVRGICLRQLGVGSVAGGCTALYNPTRIICAMPHASLRSLLLTRADNAAFMCRVSTQMIGKPASANSPYSHCDNGPASSPIRAIVKALSARVKTCHVDLA